MKQDNKSVIKSSYFSNWSDNFGYPIAYKLLPYVAKIPGITPNKVTLFSFGLYTLGSILLFVNIPYHLLLSAILLPAGYIGDDIDGQLARYKNMSSHIGDYLDKVLDVLKIFIITASLSYAVYLQTHELIYIYFGFAACFFFLWRYYIKLETLFSQINNDVDYLKKSDVKRAELIEQMQKEKGLIAFLKKHRILFVVDEAEFVIITAVGALFNQLAWALIIIALAQICWGFYRFYERGSQINSASKRLLWPMRK